MFSDPDNKSKASGDLHRGETAKANRLVRVQPVASGEFDFEAFIDYESMLLKRCWEFWSRPKGDSAVLVYSALRRTGGRQRPKTFSCCGTDFRAMLCQQLDELKESMKFRSDVPHFLQPWRGTGLIAEAFESESRGTECARPPARNRFQPRFRSVADALGCDALPIEQTPAGKRALEIIDYFINETQGRLPMSLVCTQSAPDVACSIVDVDSLFTEMYDNPQAVEELLSRITRLIVDFTRRQVECIGRALVWPGYDFASCRCFNGLGMSDETALMLSEGHFLRFAVPADEFAARPFGGLGFHCCGNWSSKIKAVKRINGLRIVDAAFTEAADPVPNKPEPFAEGFSNTGVAVNARIMGSCKTILEIVKRLWKPPMKLIVVTDCRTPQEQADVYDRIHEICG